MKLSFEISDPLLLRKSHTAAYMFICFIKTEGNKKGRKEKKKGGRKKNLEKENMVQHI